MLPHHDHKIEISSDTTSILFSLLLCYLGGSSEIVFDYMSKDSNRNGQFRLLKLGKNRGKGGAVKRGVAVSKGKYILMVSKSYIKY